MLDNVATYQLHGQSIYRLSILSYSLSVIVRNWLDS